MKADAFLIAGRIGRWRWPWALIGSVVTIALVFAISIATEPLEFWLAARYGESGPELDLIPGRPDTYASFLIFALSLTLPPALVFAAVHRIDPRTPLGPHARFQWTYCVRASIAILLVLMAGLMIGLLREPQNFRWPARGADHLPWVVLAVVVIFFQSFAEEYLFKGYFLRVWGAVLPLRSVVVLAIACLFTAGHAVNDDVAQDLAFNLVFFFLGELLTLAVYLRTESLAAVTGLHWINNVWSMCIQSTDPGQSSALAFIVYSDQVIREGGSRLADPFAYLEMAAGLLAVWLLLTLRYSPFFLPRAERERPTAAISVFPPM